MGGGAVIASGVSFLLLLGKVIAGCIKHCSGLTHMKHGYVERDMHATFWLLTVTGGGESLFGAGASWLERKWFRDCCSFPKGHLETSMLDFRYTGVMKLGRKLCHFPSKSMLLE